jgi:hypothetical protein
MELGNIMIGKIASAGIALATLAALPAAAACGQANAVGTWKLYDGSFDNSGAAWAKCTLYIARSGVFGAASTCSNNVGQSTGATGHVTVINAANCTFGGSLTYTANGAVSTVNEATMAQDHMTVAGVGTFSGGGFVFAMVKVK